MQLNHMETAFAAAFAGAIRKIGVAQFKRTSFFGSNEAHEIQLKKAA